MKLRLLTLVLSVLNCHFLFSAASIYYDKNGNILEPGSRVLIESEYKGVIESFEEADSVKMVASFKGDVEDYIYTLFSDEVSKTSLNQNGELPRTEENAHIFSNIRKDRGLDPYSVRVSDRRRRSRAVVRIEGDSKSIFYIDVEDIKDLLVVIPNEDKKEGYNLGDYVVVNKNLGTITKIDEGDHISISLIYEWGAEQKLSFFKEEHPKISFKEGDEITKNEWTKSFFEKYANPERVLVESVQKRNRVVVTSYDKKFKYYIEKTHVPKFVSRPSFPPSYAHFLVDRHGHKLKIGDDVFVEDMDTPGVLVEVGPADCYFLKCTDSEDSYRFQAFYKEEIPSDFRLEKGTEIPKNPSTQDLYGKCGSPKNIEIFRVLSKVRAVVDIGRTDLYFNLHDINQFLSVKKDTKYEGHYVYYEDIKQYVQILKLYSNKKIILKTKDGKFYLSSSKFFSFRESEKKIYRRTSDGLKVAFIVKDPDLFKLDPVFTVEERSFDLPKSRASFEILMETGKRVPEPLSGVLEFRTEVEQIKFDSIILRVNDFIYHKGLKSYLQILRIFSNGQILIRNESDESGEVSTIEKLEENDFRLVEGFELSELRVRFEVEENTEEEETAQEAEELKDPLNTTVKSAWVQELAKAFVQSLVFFRHDKKFR